METLQGRAPPLGRMEASAAWTWIAPLGFALIAVPALFTLVEQGWSHEIGAHGPIILATGAWLLWRVRPDFAAHGKPGSVWLTSLLLLPALASYVAGRTYGFLFLEALGVYGAGLALLQSRVGSAMMLKNWFPLLYLGLSIPPPTWIIDFLTAPLKQFVTIVSTDGLHSLGFPVARQGVTIFVAQYQLLVEDACSGMHSIIGLIAITLLYIYLTHGPSWRQSLLFTALAIPIAIVANILRIVALVLLTYFYGDAVAQGFLHFTAGILLFAVALVLVFAIDQGLTYLRARLRRPA